VQLWSLCHAVIETARSAQLQNGLRHNDYEGYRQYCARRLRRVRVRRDIRFLHSKSRHKHDFVPRELAEEDVRTGDHLLIPLFNAERAWAYSMELKQQVDEVIATGEGTVRPHHHRMRRLRKACEWAELLRKLAEARGDARTSLEAEAYASTMQSRLLAEEREWVETLVQLAAARAALMALAAAASPRVKRIFLDRLKELDPVERFAKHNLRKAGGGSALDKALASAADAVTALGPKIRAVETSVASTGTAVDKGVSSVATSADDGVEAVAALYSDGWFSVPDLSDGRVHWAGSPSQAPTDGPTSRSLSALGQRLGDVARARSALLARPSDAEASRAYDEAVLTFMTGLDELGRGAATEADRLRRGQRPGDAEDVDIIASAARWHHQRMLMQRSGQDASVAVEAALTAMDGAVSALDGTGKALPPISEGRALESLAAGAPSTSAVLSSRVLVPLASTLLVRAADAAGTASAGGWRSQAADALSSLRSAIGLLDRCSRAMEEIGAGLDSLTPEGRWVQVTTSAISARRSAALAAWHGLSGDADKARALFLLASIKAVEGSGVEHSVSDKGFVSLTASPKFDASPVVADAQRESLALAAAAAVGGIRSVAATAAVAAGGDGSAVLQKQLGLSGGRGSASHSEALAPTVAALEIGGPVLSGGAHLPPVQPLPLWVGLKPLHFDVSYSMIEPPSLDGRFARKTKAPEPAAAATAAASVPPPTAATPPPSDKPPATGAQDEGVIGSLFRMFTG
jgi:hypothetical protein